MRRAGVWVGWWAVMYANFVVGLVILIGAKWMVSWIAMELSWVAMVVVMDSLEVRMGKMKAMGVVRGRLLRLM